jgi:chemotaxis protein MotB
MTEFTRELLDQTARVLEKLPNNILISGHADANPLNRDDYSNCELSSDPANANRRELTSSGIGPSRIVQVTSEAVQEPLIEEDPFLPHDRRVSMVLNRPRQPYPLAFSNSAWQAQGAPPR